MLSRVWGLCCVCACVTACGNSDNTTEPIGGDATRPTTIDLDMTRPDMDRPFDQSVETDAMVSNQMDMTVDMNVQKDAMVITDADLDCLDACIEDSLTWGRIGGFTPYNVIYTLNPCNTQIVQIESFNAVDPDALRCERTAPGCGSEARITLQDVLAKLAIVSRTNAFDFRGVYGVDSRPVDGQVFSIVFQGQELLLGDPCGGSVSDCTNPPPEVIELADLLWDFGRAMENNEPSCANIRDGL